MFISRPTIISLAVLSLLACGVEDVVEDDSLEGSDSALSASVPIGSTLRATGNVNLRSGPSTSNSIKTVVPKNATVTTVNRTTPSGVFYNVSYAGQVGWVSGNYLALVSSPGGSGGGGGSSCSSAFTCTADGMARERCNEREACPQGCLRTAAGTDARCLGGSYTLSCTGSYGTQKSTKGDYYITAFGCWTDANGGLHGDSGDNCIPSCLSQARAAGLCLPGDTGKRCEERVTWYTADGARFGCLARLKMTNPANGKSVIAVALDFGPACRVENSVNMPVLDASGRINRYLFGADQGAVDRSTVHVIEVDPSTPLGPVP